MPSPPVKRLTITLEIAFGKDEPAEDPGGDVYTSTERRHTDEATEARTIGFGRPTWEDKQ